jgi:AraC family transcriptional activator of pobA
MKQFATAIDTSITSDRKLTVVRNNEVAALQPPNSWQEENFKIFRHLGSNVADLVIQKGYRALVLCLNGTCNESVNQFRVHITANTMHLVTPQSNTVFTDASEDLELFLILYKEEFIKDSLIREAMIENLLEPEFGQPTLCDLEEDNMGLILGLFEKIEKEYQTQQAHHSQMIHLFFIELMLEASRTNTKCSERTLRHASRPKTLINQFKKLIEVHFLELRTVQQYADLLFVTPKHLSEVVKHGTGLTPLYLIHNRTFQEAGYWLCASELTIKEIAEKLNFDTSSHFSRFFKQYSGYNPTDYQRIQCSML